MRVSVHLRFSGSSELDIELLNLVLNCSVTGTLAQALRVVLFVAVVRVLALRRIEAMNLDDNVRRGRARRGRGTAAAAMVAAAMGW